MKLDIKILEELKRYNSINNYLMEQDAPAPPPADPTAVTPPAPGETPDAGLPPAAPTPPTDSVTKPTEPVDVEKDPEVEKISKKDEKTKEVDVTELVNTSKSVGEKQDEYFETLFNHLENLEGKLSEMDSIVNKLNSLEAKIEKYRVKSPEEKMELRTLDSGPYNQKLSDFFNDKQVDFEKTGKEQYVLTQDEVENYQPVDIKKSFRNFDDEDEFKIS